jgi:hypothetical protein
MSYKFLLWHISEQNLPILRHHYLLLLYCRKPPSPATTGSRHGVSPPSPQQPSTYVLACSRSLYPASRSFELESIESVFLRSQRYWRYQHALLLSTQHWNSYGPIKEGVEVLNGPSVEVTSDTVRSGEQSAERCITTRNRTVTSI